MKTPEEWALYFGYSHTDFIEPHCLHISGANFVKIVEMIQEDMTENKQSEHE